MPAATATTTLRVMTMASAVDAGQEAEPGKHRKRHAQGGGDPYLTAPESEEHRPVVAGDDPEGGVEAGPRRLAYPRRQRIAVAPLAVSAARTAAKVPYPTS